MKKNLTEMVFILDSSGSMEPLADDTIGGFNSLIEEQRKEEREAYITTVLFNTYHDVIHNHIDIREVPNLTRNTYRTFGCTALLDAIGLTIDNVGERLAETPEEDRPEKVIFVIITDGQENSSREYSKSKVKEMIEHQQNKYSWTFMFLGANMDAVSEAGSLGINTDFSKTYTASAQGTSSVYYATSKAMSCLRSMDYDGITTNSISYKAVVDALDEVK